MRAALGRSGSARTTGSDDLDDALGSGRAEHGIFGVGDRRRGDKDDQRQNTRLQEGPRQHERLRSDSTCTTSHTSSNRSTRLTV